MLHWVIEDRRGPDRAGRTGLRKTGPGKVECRTGLGETWHGQQNRTGAGLGRFVQGRAVSCSTGQCSARQSGTEQRQTGPGNAGKDRAGLQMIGQCWAGLGKT